MQTNSIEEKLRKLDNICRERGWKLASIDWHTSNNFSIIVENPENGGRIELEIQATSLYTDLIRLGYFDIPPEKAQKMAEEKLNILLKIFDEKRQVKDWRAVLGILEDLILRNKISIYTNWTCYVTCARIALEIGMKATLRDSFIISKPVEEKVVKRFMNLYGDIIKSIPEQKLSKILLRHPLVKDFIYHDVIAKNLPKLPSTIYIVKAKEHLTEDDLQAVRKTLFEGNMNRRLILAEALIHRLMNDVKDTRLEEIIIDYLDKRATRREALILWGKFLKVKKPMFVRGGNEVFKKIVEKALNLKDLKVYDDESFLKLPEKILLDISLRELSIRPAERMFDYTFGIDIIFEKPPWKLKVDGLRNLDAILSKSITHVSEMRNYVKSVIGEMADVLKMMHLSYGDVKFALKNPPKVVIRDCSEDLIESFENALKRTFQKICLKIGNEELSLRDLEKIAVEKAKFRSSVELR